MENVRPIGNRVLVEMVPAPPKTAGGIILTEVQQEIEGKKRAKVVALGEGRWLECGKLVPPPFEVGDTVVFSPRAVGVDIPRDEDEVRDPEAPKPPEQHVVDVEMIVAVRRKQPKADGSGN